MATSLRRVFFLAKSNLSTNGLDPTTALAATQNGVQACYHNDHGS